MAVREILFRGKRIDNGEWVYGYLAKLKWYCDDSDVSIIIPTDGDLYPRCEISSYEPVDPETIGQWTGLVDKNGTKIFEGDVVRYKYTSRVFDDTDLIEHCTNHPELTFELTKTVVYKDGEFTPRPKIYNCSDYWYSYAYCDFEVIGNIWDNPELVKK